MMSSIQGGPALPRLVGSGLCLVAFVGALTGLLPWIVVPVAYLPTLAILWYLQDRERDRPDANHAPAHDAPNEG
jgi:hypothetical protein